MVADSQLKMLLKINVERCRQGCRNSADQAPNWRVLVYSFTTAVYQSSIATRTVSLTLASEATMSNAARWTCAPLERRSILPQRGGAALPWEEKTSLAQNKVSSLPEKGSAVFKTAVGSPYSKCLTAPGGGGNEHTPA